MLDPKRRSFLKWCTHALGTVVAAILGVPAIAYLIDARNRAAPASDFRPVHGIRVSDVKEINRPMQGVIRDVRQDAWTLHPNDVIGRVWIVRAKPGAMRRLLSSVYDRMPASGMRDQHQAETPQRTPASNVPAMARNSHAAAPASNGAATRIRHRATWIPWNCNWRATRTTPTPNNRDLFMVRFQKFYQTRATKDVRA